MRILIVSTYLPQQCGIATYSFDLLHAMQLNPFDQISILAMTHHDQMNHPKEVVASIQKQNIEDYTKATSFANEQFDICLLQHEYGIFGGPDGEYILEFIEKLSIPLITNFHTVLENPSLNQQRIITKLQEKSNKITIMTERAVDLLTSHYGIDLNHINLIRHGVPIFEIDPIKAKNMLNLPVSKTIILSFGFLGRGKGFETVIDAIALLSELDILYIILGTTHPNVLRDEGEKYRDFLAEKIARNKINDQVMMINKFADYQELKNYLSACDIYVTPYPNANQISSGTLAFALGAGKPIVSTPFNYAKDLLAFDRGLFFNFNDSEDLADNLRALIENPEKSQQYRNNAKSFGETMQWPKIASQILELLKSTISTHIS